MDSLTGRILKNILFILKRISMIVLLLFMATSQTATVSARGYYRPMDEDPNILNAKFICSSAYFSRYKDWALRLPGDKLKHCSLSCVVARRCPHWEVEAIGILKEVVDLFGYGNPETSDIAANRRGIRFSSITKSDMDCVRFCRQVY